MPVKTKARAVKKKAPEPAPKKVAPVKKTKAAAAPARQASATTVKKAPAEAEAAPDRNAMKKQSKTAVAEPPVDPKPMPSAPLSRSALIKLRHEMMKKEIDQIREDLEAEENDE